MMTMYWTDIKRVVELCWAGMMKEHPCLRRGQALFNTFELVVPDFAEELRHSNDDPFFNDHFIDEAWDFFTEWLGKPQKPRELRNQ